MSDQPSLFDLFDESHAWGMQNARHAADRFTASKRDQEDEVDPSINRLKKILQAIDGSLREQVQGWIRKWNQLLRESMRNQTALRLSVGDERTAIPIRLCDGMPQALGSALAQLDDDQLAMLLKAPVLGQASEGLRMLSAHTFSAGGKLSWVEAEQPALKQSGEVVAKLLQQVGLAELLARLGAIDEDVLGAYYFNIPEIRIYWMSIGFVSSMLNVDPEALTIVTLAHELAHAYTHKGQDIDGNRWDSGFAQSDLVVVEGLAQFYTQQCCHDMVQRNPLVPRAFEVLHNHQSAAYQAFGEWLPEQMASASEVMRFGLIQSRMQGSVAHQALQDHLATISKQVDRRYRGEADVDGLERARLEQAILRALVSHDTELPRADLIKKVGATGVRPILLHLMSTGMLVRTLKGKAAHYMVTARGRERLTNLDKADTSGSHA